MMDRQQRQWILDRAYVPEHVPELMSGVSGGQTLLVRDYLGCRTDRWFALVGYPLENPFSEEGLASVIDEICLKYRPWTLSVIAPRLPASVCARCTERESDRYYVLELDDFRVPGALRRMVRKAGQQLTIARGSAFTREHTRLALEFVRRVKPGPRIETLLDRMPAYLNASQHALVLEAWTRENCLSAFYVVDLATPAFGVYVIGGHSKKHYVPGASDLLFFEMVQVCRQAGKARIHLGLGVNAGIRRFKQKWGAQPGLPYEMGEWVIRKPSVLDFLSIMGRKA